jgi:hypothetical protein
MRNVYVPDDHFAVLCLRCSKLTLDTHMHMNMHTTTRSAHSFSQRTWQDNNHAWCAGCLTIELSSPAFCINDISAPPNERCTDEFIEALIGIEGRAPVSTKIDIESSAVDAYGRQLQDTCSICIRHADVVALDQALSKETSLVVRDLVVAAPSRAGLPTLIEGGAVAGNYTVYLELVNWLNVTGRYVVCICTHLCVCFCAGFSCSAYM